MSFLKEIVNEGIECLVFANQSSPFLEQRCGTHIVGDFGNFSGRREMRAKESLIRGQHIYYDRRVGTLLEN